MHTLHLEYVPGAVEVWALWGETPVASIRCRNEPEISAAVSRLRARYAIEPDEPLEPMTAEESARELRQLARRTAALRARQAARREAKRRGASVPRRSSSIR